MHISAIDLAAMSTGARKGLEPYLTRSAGFLYDLSPSAPPEVQQFLIQLQLQRALVWCSRHAMWEPLHNTCVPPQRYSPEKEFQGGFSGQQQLDKMKDALKAANMREKPDEGTPKAGTSPNGKPIESTKTEPTKKWHKIYINICPKCHIETHRRVRVDSKKPEDPMELVEYEEKECGCTVLKDIFSLG